MKHLKVLTVLSVLILCSFGFGQALNVTLDLVVLNPNALVFPVGDLDFINTGLSQNYFNIIIRNDEPNPVDMGMKLEIFYNGVLIASGNSNTFTLPANPNPSGMGQEFILTSQQLSLGNAMINGQSIELSDYDVDWDAVDNLEKQVLRTGNAPAGEYIFFLTGVPNNPNVTIPPDQEQGNNTITITNPTYIELLFPGRSVSEAIIPQINTLYPYFQYQTDVPPANASYNVFVYQKYPEDETTQDVLSHPPIFHIEGYPNNFLQYPTDTQSLFGGGNVLALRMLEEGGIYYWYVQSVIPSGTGTETLESDVFRFKIAEVLQQGAGNAQQILAVLQQILGSKYEQVLSDLRAQGFDPNGNFTYDGKNVNINALFELAGQIARGEKQIENVEVQDF